MHKLYKFQSWAFGVFSSAVEFKKLILESLTINYQFLGQVY